MADTTLVKRARGRPAFEPSPKDRGTVRAMAGYGIPQLEIARVVGISDRTLREHFRNELDTAVAQANAAVAQSLYQQATKGGSTTAAIFWLKCRAGWREPPQGIEHSGKDGGPVQIEAVMQYQIPANGRDPA